MDEDGFRLDDEVRKGLSKIAQDFVDNLKKDNNISIKILDVVIIGSVANYNWTNYSDIDLHIITDYSDLDMSPEDAQTMFDAIKVNWNNKHDIKMKGHDVEIYVQDKSHKPVSTAEYSVINKKWNKEPKKEKPEFNKELIKKKYKEYKGKINALISKHDETALKKLLDKLYKFRQAGLDSGGELSEENIVFKILRAYGYLDKLKDSIAKSYDTKMSVKEVELEEIDQIDDGISSPDGKEVIWDYDDNEGEFSLVPTDDEDQRRVFKVYGIPVYAAYRVMSKGVTAMAHSDDEGSRQMAHDLVNIRTAIKHPAKGSKKTVSELVDISVDRFFNEKKIDASKITVIIPLGSKSVLNKEVAEKIKKRLPNAVVLENFLQKDTWKNVKLSPVFWNAVARRKKEGKPIDWYEGFANSIKRKKQMHANELFGIKNVPPTTRMYFSMFYRTSDNYIVDAVKKLNGANVLLIDDTLEAGATLVEAARALNQYKIKNLMAYIFLYGRDIKIAPAVPVEK